MGNKLSVISCWIHTHGVKNVLEIHQRTVKFEHSFTSLLARPPSTIYCGIPPSLSNIFLPFSHPSLHASKAVLSLLVLTLDLYSYIFFTLLYPAYVSNLPIPKAYTMYSSLAVYISCMQRPKENLPTPAVQVSMHQA